nr:unnamed protein product [Naegleria fowleri]
MFTPIQRNFSSISDFHYIRMHMDSIKFTVYISNPYSPTTKKSKMNILVPLATCFTVALICALCSNVIVVQADRPVPRLPLSFMANNVTVSYADQNLMFVNATYYYDYYFRMERIDLLDTDKTYLTNKTIINFYGPRVDKKNSLKNSLQVPVTTYVIDYQRMKFNNNKWITLYNCTKTNQYWQFGYAMKDMPYWTVQEQDPNYYVSFVKYGLDGGLRFELWQDQYNGESKIYHISTETRSVEFAQLLRAQDDMVSLNIKGSQIPFVLSSEYFNVKNFGCE